MKINKLIILIFIFAIFFTGKTYADENFSISSGLGWLEDNVDWQNDDVEDVSLAVLALISNGRSANEGLAALRDRQSSDFSWNNDVKDTALATLALSENGQNVADEIEWLEDARQGKFTGGTWFVQIKSEANGTCSVAFDNLSLDVKVEGDEVICRNRRDFWIDTNCFGNRFSEFEFECSDLGSPLISLIFQSSQGIFLLDDNEGSFRASIDLQNSCFGSRGGVRTCNYEPSSYASWVLNENNKDPKTKNYLRLDSRDRTRLRILDNSFLLLITEDKKYADFLAENQNNVSGSFDNDVFATALAVLALRTSGNSGVDIEKAVTWLERKQSSDGSWEKNIQSTAMTLFAVFSTRGPLIGTCNNNNICDPGENSGSCPSDCASSSICTSDFDCPQGFICNNSTGQCVESGCTSDSDCDFDEVCDLLTNTCVSDTNTGVICNNNGICDSNENSIDCSSDCFCGDNVCSSDEDDVICADDCKVEASVCGDSVCSSDEDPTSCPQDCTVQPSKGFPKWIITLIIILVLVVGVFFGARKFRGRKRKGKRPSFDEFLKERQKTESATARPTTPTIRSMPPVPRPKTTSRESLLEKQLDESIRKAKELLKKK